MSDPDEFHLMAEAPDVKTHRQYVLKDGEVVSHVVEKHVADAAEKEALPGLNSGDYALRTCWNCNPAHSRFLEDRTDNHMFTCTGCGHWFYNGLDLSGDDE